MSIAASATERRRRAILRAAMRDYPQLNHKSRKMTDRKIADRKIAGRKIAGRKWRLKRGGLHFSAQHFSAARRHTHCSLRIVDVLNLLMRR
jgi:hypothetical protein